MNHATRPSRPSTLLSLLVLALWACEPSEPSGGASTGDAAGAQDSVVADAGADAASDLGGHAGGADDGTGDGLGGVDGASGDAAGADDGGADDTGAPDGAGIDDAATDAADAGDWQPAVGLTTLTVQTPAGRTLPGIVWYPAVTDGTFTPEVFLGLLAGQGLRDAPVAEGGPWPLIVFSHGSQAFKEQSLFLVEGLTRHGYVVAAVDHIGNTFMTQNEEKMGEVARERPRDISALIDRLMAPESGDPSWFSTHIDFDRIAAAGHSFGGYTVMALAGGVLSVPQSVVDECALKPKDLICSVISQGDPGPLDLRDPRVDAVIAMTPGGYMAFREEGLTSVAVPTMIMGGLADDVTTMDDEILPFYEGIPGTKYLWTLAHGQHFTWSDFCLIVPFLSEELAAQFGADLCKPDAPLPIATAHTLIFDMSLAFFDAWLRDDQDAAARLQPSWAEAQSPEVGMSVSP
ncbi:MAG: hypothetical protein AMXMBFR64_49180 [Myxococcales bacterium]